MQNKFIKNIVFGFGGQFIILILEIIIPRIMIVNYGSDVNGLITTVTQIFTYMALLEAGIGQAAKNALFKPIAENNQNEISKIIVIAQSYFRKITIFYGIGVLILSVVAPFLLKSNLSYSTICLVILFQGLSGVVTFYYTQTNYVILDADGRGYVNNAINLFNQICSYLARIILALLGVNIVFIQVSFFLISVCKALLYKSYFKKHYNWINYTINTKNEKLKDRNAYIISEVAWTVFSSTDMIILSIFVSTQLASVYSVYNLVFANLNVLLTAVYNSVNYILGQTFHKNRELYIKIHDAYNSIFLGGITILMCVAYILILPFVQLYTRGVTDINYIYPMLPVIFCLIQILSWSRYVTGNLTAVAGYAKYTGYVSVAEATINILLSVILVNKYGIVGVGIATVIALPLKIIVCTYLSDKVILKRSCKKTIIILFANYLVFGTAVWSSNYLNLSINNYFEFFLYGILFFVIFAVLGMFVNMIANPNLIKMSKLMYSKVCNYIKGRK